jgi:hypothetical protein
VRRVCGAARAGSALNYGFVLDNAMACRSGAGARSRRVLISAFTESVRKTCEDAKLKMIEGNDEVQ